MASKIDEIAKIEELIRKNEHWLDDYGMLTYMLYGEGCRYTKPILTQDEKSILKSLPKGFNYIARDRDGDLCIYKVKPEKDLEDSVWSCSHYGDCKELLVVGFSYIKWDDNEPYSINDLLEL